MMPENAKPFIAARDLLLRLGRDYDAAMREFRWPVLQQFNWALDYFDHLPADRLALWCIGAGEDEKLTFGALSARSNQVANHLRRLGVLRGDRVLLLLPNIWQLWETILALIKLGAVFTPCSTLLTPVELADRMRRGRVKHAIVHAPLTDRFADFADNCTRIAVGGAVGWQRFEDAYAASETFVSDGETRPDDPMVMYFTSGTTAKPKLVLHSHQSYPVGQLSTTYFFGVRADDVVLFVASPGWAAHLYILFGSWNAGAAIVALAYPQFEARAVLDALVRCGVTVFGGPPTVWRMLMREDLATWPVKLHEAVSGGEPLNSEIIDHIRRVWGLTLRDVYGQTETTAVIGCAPGQPVAPSAMGRPLPGFVIKLLDDNGAEASEGEIAIALEPRPLGLLQGYQQDDGALQPLSGQYHLTGDLARSDADGRLTFVGRADDVFKSSGYRISPFEIESALLEHEAVVEVAVVPSPDAQRLVVPKAFIILAAGRRPDRATALDIFARLRVRLAAYQRVRRIEFAEALPLTISGKIRRSELRQREATRSFDGGRADVEFWEEDFPELRRRTVSTG
jgi:acetyl-CoA synthetase